MQVSMSDGLDIFTPEFLERTRAVTEKYDKTYVVRNMDHALLKIYEELAEAAKTKDHGTMMYELCDVIMVSLAALHLCNVKDKGINSLMHFTLIKAEDKAEARLKAHEIQQKADDLTRAVRNDRF